MANKLEEKNRFKTLRVRSASRCCMMEWNSPFLDLDFIPVIKDLEITSNKYMGITENIRAINCNNKCAVHSLFSARLMTTAL
jgi:hypothetical protein